ncbi:RHS repeat-associated core domain-containing protein [Capnocytophaga sp. ARDL2]|uniref:RHS repeat-associated core domain-containing protein n=1 Tax=Capnocytophaga sp. ARDL2 TaxID=3238809 RepID=UPI0035564B07
MSGRYKYNSKEIDQATGMYYYGARYYDPRLSIFVSVDPLAEVQPDKTPYHFVSNNPITRVDPTGMADHDYRLNSDGTISEKPIRETNSPLDRLILFDDNGKETDCSIDIEKGILNNVKRNVLNDLEKKYSYFKVNNNKDAKDIFEFLSENTKVEWGHISFGKTSNYIATSNHETQENGGIHLIKNLIEKKYSVNFYIHSHPDDGKQYRYYGSFWWI